MTPKAAEWPFSLPPGLSPAAVDEIASEADRLGAEAQYGWGHSIDFGPFRKEGLLGDAYLTIAGALDEWAWWPARLDRLRVADVGCFTGGLSLLLADRGAEVVYAIDEIPQHAAQCAFIARVFDVPAVRPVVQSAYRINEEIELGTLDLVLLSGVLYHMSDMLVGLYAMREVLEPGGSLVIQSNAIRDFRRSYANFGRFVAGRWWQPTARCLLDMLELMGFSDCELRFYGPRQCLARARRADGDIPFKRGLNRTFDDPRDARPRSLDESLMAPARRQLRAVLRRSAARVRSKPPGAATPRGR
jgi:SAM-dependent methyltransferase